MVILYLYAQLREMSFAKCLNNVLFPALILKSDHRINLNFVVYTISGIKFQVFHYISFQRAEFTVILYLFAQLREMSFAKC